MLLQKERNLCKKKVYYCNQIEFTIFLLSAFIEQTCKFFFLVIHTAQSLATGQQLGNAHSPVFIANV